jgi:Flp pilus assembly protein TadG
VTPLFFLFLCGIFEFGYILLNQIQIQNGVRVGSRYAALGSCSATDSQIQTQVQNSAAGLPVTIASSYNPAPCSACAGVGVGVPTVTINGTYAYQAITPVGVFFGFFGGTFGNTLTLTSQSTLNNEC